jgi:hypothetical protein
MATAVQFLNDVIAQDPTGGAVFNWEEIAKLPLTDDFIFRYSSKLPWNVISSSQRLSPALVERFDHLLNYTMMSKNPNLDPNVFAICSDKMDWESVQIYQKLSPDMLRKFSGQLNPMTVLRYQKLDEPMIYEFISPIMEKKQLATLKAMLDIVFEYQSVGETFVRTMLEFEACLTTPTVLAPPTPTVPAIAEIQQPPGPPPMDDSTPPAPVPPPVEPASSMPARTLHIVNLPVVLRFQKLSTEFLQKITDPTLVDQICQYQKLSREFILKMTDHTRHMTKLLRYQTVKFTDFELVIRSDINNIIGFVKYQQYDDVLLANLVAGLKDTVVTELYNAVLLRTLKPARDPSALFWSNEIVEEAVMPKVDWDTLVTFCTLEEASILLTRYPTKIPWYILIKNQNLSERQILDASAAGYIGAIEWWMALTKARPADMALSDNFLKEHAQKKIWWNYIQPGAKEKFYESCMGVLVMGEEYDKASDNRSGRNNIRTFLRDFVKQADWKHILRFTQLEEWFIRIFSHFAKEIDMFWWKICTYQQLSERFIKSNLEKMDLNVIVANQKLSQEFLNELSPYFDDDAWDKVKKYQTNFTIPPHQKAYDIGVTAMPVAVQDC